MPEFGSPFAGLANDRKLTDKELVRAIRFMVAAEYEAVQLYMQLAESTGNKLAVEVLKDIADEERVHAGEFLRLLRELAPDEEKFYAKGAEEVEVTMKRYYVKIKSIRHITHDVLHISVEKPQQFHFSPGQATKISINKEGWQGKKEPFTFTSLPHEDHLQFTIKTYPSHKGVTNELLKLKKGDELILHGVFGTIAYKKEGLFIAGGAGVTPFISIFRYLRFKNEVGDNKLIFANKTKDDIILKNEFKKLLGKNFINILSDEDVKGYAHGFITEKFIKANMTGLDKNIYVCGPPQMMDAIEKILSNLHVDEKLIVKEVF
jgi:ferredoxin-NADP reductase